MKGDEEKAIDQSISPVTNQKDPQPRYTPAPPVNPYEDERATRVNPMKNFIIMGIIAIAVTFVFTSFITPMASKRAYEADITRLETDLVAMRAVETGLSEQIASLETSNSALSSSITTQLQEAVDQLTAQINSLISDADFQLEGYATTAEVASINSAIAELQADIVALAAQVVALEEEPTGDGTTAEEDIVVSLKTWGGYNFTRGRNGTYNNIQGNV